MYDEIARSEAESGTVKCLKLQENALELKHIIPRDRVIGYLCSIKAGDKDKTYLNKLFKASELVNTIVTEGRNKHNPVGIVDRTHSLSHRYPYSHLLNQKPC